MRANFPSEPNVVFFTHKAAMSLLADAAQLSRLLIQNGVFGFFFSSLLHLHLPFREEQMRTVWLALGAFSCSELSS